MVDNIGKILFQWEADEFTTYQRGIWWHVGVIAVALLAMAYAAYIQNWLFIGVIVMVVVALYVVGRARPRRFTHLITDQGVMVAEKLYLYNELKSFWITQENGAVLNLMQAKKYALLLTLQLDRSDVEQVREILSEYLPEEPNRGEDTINKIGRFLKF